MKATEVIQKHNSYEIAKANKIIVVAEPLGKINGYYNKTFGQKFIHINDKLPENRWHDVVKHILPIALKDRQEMYFLTKLKGSAEN